MEQRTLGATDVKVSALGFGCGAFAGLLVRGERRQQVEAVRTALEGGLTYFDTAAQYGDGLSEENLGTALAELGATQRALIGTKVRLTAGELEEPEPAIRASLQASLRRLRRDAVDVLVLHNFPRSTTARDGVQTRHLGGVAAAMRALQQEGLVRCAGLTGVGETAAVREAVETGLFDFGQFYFNALNPSAVFPAATGGGQDFEGVVRLAAAAGTGSMAVRSVAGGALVATDYRAPLAGPTGFGGGLGGSPYSNDLELARRLLPLARELGLENVLELGLRFVLTRPELSTALVGFSDAEQVAQALRWAARGPLPEDVCDDVVEVARSGTVVA